ncbi:MAG: iron-regulated protein [Rhizobiales bacterium]|nr:iron-regulated protein [Hyphomicrobiales bacterium]
MRDAIPTTTVISRSLKSVAVVGLLALAAATPLQASGPGGIPASFALEHSATPSFGATREITAYVDLVHTAYVRAHDEAAKMQAAIDTFLKTPTEENLALARKAWIAARPAYLETEAFRFYQGPIDFADPETGDEGPEGRINAWPLNEAYIDYVKGNEKAGLINDPSIEITPESIKSHDQQTDESDVTTGWHAIEFLLWGQDFSADGPGARPASDYAPGNPVHERRALYLRTVTEMLVDDLTWLSAQWDTRLPKVYAQKFLELDQKEALGRILTGVAVLSGFELASERMGVGLDSGDQEDEQSCFSDNTHADFVYDQQGVANIWFGMLGDEKFAGLKGLAERVDPALAKSITEKINETSASIAAIPSPIDQVLASPAGSPGRVAMEQAITNLQAQAQLLSEFGKKLGLRVEVASE